MTTFEITSIVLGSLTFISASLFAYIQVRINRKILKNESFTELFIYPINNSDGVLILRNISSTPIYMSSYKFGNTTTDTGKACIANTSDCYRQLHIPQEDIENKNFTLEIIFYDLESNKYLSKHSGKIVNTYWRVNSQKANKL